MDKKLVERQVTKIENFIKSYFSENGTPDTKAVIGISGGKDSTIAAALLVRALGKDRVIGVMMPQGHQSDLQDAVAVCKYLGITHYTINIKTICDELYTAFTLNTSMNITPQVKTNSPARIRMNILYMVAANVGGRVCNTGNASEFFIGYTTKYGDLAGDFALFRNLTVQDIYAIGDYLGLPSYLVHKAPADGMTGLTDEDNTGIPYSVIDDYILEGIVPDMPTYEKMMTAHKRNRHKNVIVLPAPRREYPVINNPYYRHF